MACIDSMSETLGHTTYVGLEGETTEWGDIQRKMGNLPPHPPKFVPDKFVPSADTDDRDDPSRIARASSRAELESMEDDFGDDRFLEEYRRRRMEELRVGASVPRFGSVTEITRASFVREVTDCSSKHFVVVFLFRPHCGKCELVETALDELSGKYPGTKFTKALAGDIMPGYLDKNVPTVLVYRSRNVCATLIGLDAYGGERHMTVEGVSLALNETGPVCVCSGDAGDGNVGDDKFDGNDAKRRQYAEGIVASMIADGRAAREAREEG